MSDPQTATESAIEIAVARARGELERENEKLRALVANLKRANQSYSAGFASWHRERDEMRSQLGLAMFFGRQFVDAASAVGGELVEKVAELESDAAITNRQDDAQIRHLLDAHEESQTRIRAMRKRGNKLREWLVAARTIRVQQGGVKPETLAEIDVLLADWDAAAAGLAR